MKRKRLMENSHYSKNTPPSDELSVAAAKQTSELYRLRARGGVMRSFRKASGGIMLVGALASLLVATPALAKTLTTTANRFLGQPYFTTSGTNTAFGTSQNNPSGVAIDKSVIPNRAYVVDRGNNRVLIYLNASTLLNGGSANMVLGQANLSTTSCNYFGRNAASLCNPNGVAVDSSGQVYVADSSNNRVLVYSRPNSNGAFAKAVFGQGGDFTSNGCNLGSTIAGASTLCGPISVDLDSAGNVYISDTSNNRVLEYNTPFTTTATPGSGDFIADLEFGQGGGSGTDFSDNGCNTGGFVTAASLCNPQSAAVDSGGNVYIADTNNSRVLEYNTPLTTNAVADRVFGQPNVGTNNCNDNGSGASNLCSPVGVLLDASNNLYISDNGNNRVLEFNTPLTTDTVADMVFGQGNDFTSNTCNLGGPVPSSATLCGQGRMTLDGSGNLWIADFSNNRTLVINSPLTGDDQADLVLGQPDFIHNTANTPTAKSMYGAHNVVADSAGHLYISDYNNSRVLGFTGEASIGNDPAATLVIGQPDMLSSACNSGGPASAATLCNPTGVAVDSSNNLYVADFSNNRVLVYFTPFAKTSVAGSGDAIADVVIGQGGNFVSRGCNTNGTPTSRGLCNPWGVAVDPSGNLWVADYSNHRVLEYYTPLFNDQANFVIGQADFTHNQCNRGGSTTASTLCNPTGVDSDSNGNIYVADQANQRVLVYKSPLFANGTSGSGDAVADLEFGQGGGSGTDFTDASCDGGGVNATSLCNPNDVTLDTNGNVYIADGSNNRVLEFNTPLTTDTTADRVFGQADNFGANACNFGGDGPSAASECDPGGVNVDRFGNLFVADFGNNRGLLYDPPHFEPSTVTFTSSGTKTVYLVNTTAIWLNDIILNVSGDSQNEFKIAKSKGKNSCTSNLAPGAKCKVRVTFHKKSRGVKTATLSASDDATNTPQQAALTGGSAGKKH